MTFRKTLLGLILLALVASPAAIRPQGQTPLVSAGTAPPAVTSSDQAVAQAVELRRQNRHDEERELLLDHLESSPRGAEATDTVVWRLTDFFPANREIRQQTFDQMDAAQFRRIIERSHTADRFDLEAVLAEEFLDRYPTGPEAREVKHSLAVAYMMVGSGAERSLEIWNNLAQFEAGTTEGELAQVYIEAIEGPQSIPAFEVAYDILVMQARRANNHYRSLFSNRRVMDAAERDFFANYLSHPAVPRQDKVELLTKLMFAYHEAGHKQEAIDSALKVLELADYEGPFAENAALTICQNYWTNNDYQDALQNFEWFLGTYPGSPMAPRANYYKSMAHFEMGNYARAYVEFAVLQEMYPGSKYAGLAARYTGSLQQHQAERILALGDDPAAPVQQARLANDNDPREFWRLADTNPMNRFFQASVDPTEESEKRLAWLADSP